MRRTRGISLHSDVNGWRGIARHCAREGNLFEHQLGICQANFAASLLTRSSRSSILDPLLVPVHREQISEMNAERCGR
jgi:hypothetical protein